MLAVTNAVAWLLSKVCKKIILNILLAIYQQDYWLIYLFILTPEPPAFIKLLESREVVKGSDVALEGSVSGTPPFEVSCLKDLKQIRYDRRHLIDIKNDVVTIEVLKFEPGDAGKYKCTVANEVGQTTCDCEIILKG